MGRGTAEKPLVILALAVALIVAMTMTPSVAGAQPARTALARAAASKPRPGITLTPRSVAAGGTTTVAGGDCSPTNGPMNVLVSLVKPSGYVVASTSSVPNPDGTWQVQLTVPASAPSGIYGVDATCDSYNSELFYTSASLTVTAASASPWSVQATGNRQIAAGSMSAIGCGAATSCVGVGSYVDSAGVGDTLAQTWNGTKWTIADPANPPGGTSSSLNGVFCSSAAACIAVGSYIDSSGRQVTLAEGWNGTKWTTQTTANPAGGSSNVLNAVSCASSHSCTAVGSYYTYVKKQFESVGLAEQWNGTSWSAETVPPPSGATGSRSLRSLASPAEGASRWVHIRTPMKTPPSRRRGTAPLGGSRLFKPCPAANRLS